MGRCCRERRSFWGAAAHAMMSVAQEQEWPHESHRALKNAAIWFSQLRQGPLIEAYFGIAVKFHRHFYHDSMEDWNATPIGRWYMILCGGCWGRTRRELTLLRKRIASVAISRLIHGNSKRAQFGLPSKMSPISV